MTTTREGLENISAEREEVYGQYPLVDELILIIIQPVAIPDEPSGGGNIMEVVRGLHTGRSVIPSGMWEELMKAWIQEETWEKDPVT